MKLGRPLAMSLAVAIVVSGAIAHAATLPGSAGGVASRSTTIQRCGSSSTVTYTVTGGKVTSAAVTDLDSACNGGTLKLVLVGADGAKLDEGGPETVVDQSTTVTLAAGATSSAVAGYRISIVGGQP